VRAKDWTDKQQSQKDLKTKLVSRPRADGHQTEPPACVAGHNSTGGGVAVFQFRARLTRKGVRRGAGPSERLDACPAGLVVGGLGR
jgi:hypothetical protein